MIISVLQNERLDWRIAMVASSCDTLSADRLLLDPVYAFQQWPTCSRIMRNEEDKHRTITSAPPICRYLARALSPSRLLSSLRLVEHRQGTRLEVREASLRVFTSTTSVGTSGLKDVKLRLDRQRWLTPSHLRGPTRSTSSQAHASHGPSLYDLAASE